MTTGWIAKRYVAVSADYGFWSESLKRAATKCHMHGHGGPDLCGICGRQMPLGQVSTQHFVSDLSIILPPIFHIHSSISRGMDTRPISGSQICRERQDHTATKCKAT